MNKFIGEEVLVGRVDSDGDYFLCSPISQEKIVQEEEEEEDKVEDFYFDGRGLELVKTAEKLLAEKENKNSSKIVYISGAITGVPTFREDFLTRANILTSLGYKIINPAELKTVLPDADWKLCMEFSLLLLEKANCISMLDGWEKSKGAKIELGNALQKDYEVITV